MSAGLQDEAVVGLIEAAPDGILLVDAGGTIVLVNEAAEHLFGYTRADLAGQKVEVLVPERYHGRHEAERDGYVAAPRRRPMGFGLDLWGRRADGEEFPVEISLSPLPVKGEMLVVTIVRDRTQQKLIEQQRLELARSQAVEETVAGLEAIVWESDSPDRSSLTFLGGNESALLGYPREQWLREGFWLSVVHADDRVAALTFAEAAREQNRFELVYRLIAADGRVRHARDIVTVTRDAHGDVQRLRGVVLDVTERRELEDRLAQAQKMEAVGQLAGGIAHDFNNLLTVVSGYARRLLRRDAVADPVGEHHNEISQIVAATDRAAELTRQLLAFARRGQGDTEVVDPNELLGTLRPLLRRLIAEDIVFELDLHPDAPQVLMNRSDLEQICMNLILNARDALGAGGLIHVRSGRRVLDDETAGQNGVSAGLYLEVQVRDTGSGIPPEVQLRIFEPFYTTKPQGKGTGMGLATVYGIVEQSHGFIELESAVGQGTVFRVVLPAAPTASEKAVERPAEANRSTVLVVEDADALRELAAEILREEGYVVLTAANGRTALALAERHRGPLDLLITDVVMPLVSGPELAQRLRTLRPDLDVLFMSGYNDSRLVTRGIEEAKVNLLYKPFKPDDLTATVAALLRGRAES